jgi:hypothetical protein
MSLATLLNIPSAQRENTFHEFSFSNQDSHVRIINAVFAKMGTALPLYVMDPMPLWDLGIWFRNHQQAHNDMNAATGVAGNDLSSVDWRDPQQAAYWIELHWNEHLRNEMKLGLIG